jgi:hypothetical protein
MADPFRLTVAADSRFRVLVPEVASRYVEVIGGSASDGQALALAVTQAIDRIGHSAADAGAIEFAFRSSAGAVEVELTHDGRAHTVTCPLALKS